MTSFPTRVPASTLSTLGQLSTSLGTTARDTESLIASAEDLLKRSGTKLDAGTKKTLEELASLLRRTSKVTASTSAIKKSKDGLTSIIEDTWNEHTGEIDNLLNMDATAKAQSLTDSRNAILHKYDPNAMITGEGAMYQDLIETSAVDFTVTNYISIAAIFLIIAYIFKSLTVPLALVATIELAIFLNQGMNYFLGVATPFVAPTIISCVQLGATVDYAILMSARFQEELRQGKDRMEAIRIAATASDASIATSALVLFCATLGVSFPDRCHLHHAGPRCLHLRYGQYVPDAHDPLCL